MEMNKHLVEKLKTDEKKTEALYALYRANEYTVRYYNTDLIVVREVLWERNYEDFLDELSEAGISRFILANQSTELMELLHFLLNNDCQIVETTLVSQNEPYYGCSDILGLVIEL